jgi:hypothetical protein
VLCVAVLAGSARGTETSTIVSRNRALTAYAAMQRAFYSSSKKAYVQTYGQPAPAQAWPYSQALWATIDVSRLTGSSGDLTARIDGLDDYDTGHGYAPIFGSRGSIFYDDNLWIALALLDVADHGGPANLGSVRSLFQLVAGAWDANTGHPCAGGVFWTQTPTNHDRNAVTTANAALLAVELYERTGTTTYLDWARRAYGWTERCLGTSSGLVQDHIDLHGKIDPTTWSYNQGAMIATAVHLYEATHDDAYLAQAEHQADAALQEIGDPIRSGEPAVFLAIFYRDLLELTNVDHSQSDRAALQTFADEAWSQARNPKTNLFSFGGPPTLLDQAAMVQIYAALAGAPG